MGPWGMAGRVLPRACSPSVRSSSRHFELSRFWLTFSTPRPRSFLPGFFLTPPPGCLVLWVSALWVCSESQLGRPRQIHFTQPFWIPGTLNTGGYAVSHPKTGVENAFLPPCPGLHAKACWEKGGCNPAHFGALPHCKKSSFGAEATERKF